MKLLGLIKGKDAALVGMGVAIGSLGLKALKSEQAHRLYVRGVAMGLRAKEGYGRVVEEAKAQADDIVAEAAYLNMRRADDRAPAAEAADTTAAAPDQPAPDAGAQTA